MFIVLTPDFNILVNLLPLPTATEQIIELLTECGGSEVEHGLAEHADNVAQRTTWLQCAAVQERWKSPPSVLVPAAQESSAWKLLEGTCQLDGFCMTKSQLPQLVKCSRILKFERRSRAANEDDHERKAHWSRGGVNITLCYSPVHSIHAQCVLVVSLVDDRVVDIGSRSPTCESSENEGCLNAVGRCVVIYSTQGGVDSAP